MSRKSEFKKAAHAHRHHKKHPGGLRYHARATGVWVEQQPVPTTPPADQAPIGTYANPGVGPNGESSN